MSNSSDFWHRLEGTFLYYYYRLVMATARFEVEGLDNLAQVQASGRPIIWGLWHGINMPYMLYAASHFPPESFSVVMVGDERGDILGQLAAWLGGEVIGIDMKGNPVESGRKLLNVIKRLKAGQQTFLCPDGPDGPAYQPKDGVFFMAQKAGATILPWGGWSRQAYQMKRWDHYLVPYPFARIHIVIGEPIPVGRGDDEAALRDHVVAALHEVRTAAQRAAGITPWQ